MDETIISGAEQETFEDLACRLEREIKSKGFFSSRFQGKSTEHIIVEGADPEKGAGHMMPLNLRTGLRDSPVYGDDIVIGAEDKLETHAYSVVIGLFPQEPGFPRAKVVKPTLPVLRKCLDERYIVRFVEATDAMIIKYLTGEPGSKQSGPFHPGIMIDQQYNALLPSDPTHAICAGDAYSQYELTAEHKLNKPLLDIARSRASMMTEDYPEAAEMRPVRVGNSEYYVLIVHPRQARDLRMDLGDRGWSEIERNLADSEVRGQPIARDALGIIDNLILHSHPGIVTYLGGENADTPCAAALFLGCQAGMIAYGGFAKGERIADSKANPGDEEKSPFMLQQLLGFNKCRYGANLKKFNYGVIRMDTAAYE